MRLQVQLPENWINKLDDYARFLGIARSSLCNMLITEGLTRMDYKFSDVSVFGICYAKNDKYCVRESMCDTGSYCVIDLSTNKTLLTSDYKSCMDEFFKLSFGRIPEKEGV